MYWLPLVPGLVGSMIFQYRFGNQFQTFSLSALNGIALLLKAYSSGSIFTASKSRHCPIDQYVQAVPRNSVTVGDS
jgi:hypothetical protein